jgi:hypothetical protein
MKIKGLIVLSILLIVGVIVWAKVSSDEKFSLAKDLPNGALVYLQTDDLPQLIKLWDESKLKEDYLESQNFKEFQNSHLGIKLAERFVDFQTSIGFTLELSTLSRLAEKRAAIAIYDIGKLDFVYVSPMNKELFAITMFAQNSSTFAESTLEDGTSFYQIEFKVDRERQNQKLIFANIKGRFVLATREKLFLRTITAIKGKQRLYDEVNFKKLCEKITPNLITLWVDQEKLNTDYYFKRHWLMSNVEDLQNIRAGIFDVSLDENSLMEKREFLLKVPQNPARIPPSDAKDLLNKVPENVPFYRLQKINEKRLGQAIYDTLFDKQIVEQKSPKRSNHLSYYDGDNYYRSDYDYLDSDFDEDVKEAENEEIVKAEKFQTNQISDALASANPTTILTAASQQMLENPLFVEFRKVAIVSLRNPNSFQANQFENSIVKALKNRVTVADTKFIWESENSVRKLKIPLIGWEVGYVVNDNKLFIANNFECLPSFVSNENNLTESKTDFDDLTVIKLQNNEANFVDIMQKLTVENDDFFVGNISSLLAVISNVKQIEVRKSNEGLMTSEIISLKYQSTEQ